MGGEKSMQTNDFLNRVGGAGGSPDDGKEKKQPQPANRGERPNEEENWTS